MWRTIPYATSPVPGPEPWGPELRGLPKAIADLLPNGFMWTAFCPDSDQTIFESGDASQKTSQILFQLASFGHLAVQIRIKPFSHPDTPYLLDLSLTHILDRCNGVQMRFRSALVGPNAACALESEWV